jgi:hypothetical protein
MPIWHLLVNVVLEPVYLVIKSVDLVIEPVQFSLLEGRDHQALSPIGGGTFRAGRVIGSASAKPARNLEPRPWAFGTQRIANVERHIVPAIKAAVRAWW